MRSRFTITYSSRDSIPGLVETPEAARQRRLSGRKWPVAVIRYYAADVSLEEVRRALGPGEALGRMIEWRDWDTPRDHELPPDPGEQRPSFQTEVYLLLNQ